MHRALGQGECSHPATEGQKDGHVHAKLSLKWPRRGEAGTFDLHWHAGVPWSPHSEEQPQL